MKIKLTIENKTAIETALRAVNGKAEAHVYTTWGELAELARAAEEKILALVSKKLAPGACYGATSGDKVPNAYKYQRNATHVKLERGASDWFLTSVAVASIYSQGGSAHLTLTAAQDAEAVMRLRAGYRIARPPEPQAIAEPLAIAA